MVSKQSPRTTSTTSTATATTAAMSRVGAAHARPAAQTHSLMEATQRRLTAGTSACPNSSFYCRNRGHLPLRLNASMVDDQLCGARAIRAVHWCGSSCVPAAASQAETRCLRLAADCCDGSDERAGLCRNTCVEAGAAARAQLKQRAAAAAEGGEARKAYAQTWSVQEAQWRAELKRLEADIAQKQKHVSYWQGAHPPQAPVAGRTWC